MDVERLMTHRFEPVRHNVSAGDCMLYALGLGIGRDPLDPAQLRYVYEDGLGVFPTMACVIAHPGQWMRAPELDIDVTKLLHAGQSLEMHRPLRPQTGYIGEYAVLGVTDKGAEKGALMYFRKLLREEAGEIVATVTSTYLLRGDGGCGGTGYAPDPAPALAAEAGQPLADIIQPTLPQAALIYRLSGDRNPLHADPAVAAKAGFRQPILQGLCAYGMAARAVLDTSGEADANRLRRFELRFASPVLPGETLTTRAWRRGEEIGFETHAQDRGAAVLRQGYALLAACRA